jgi:hypothetical protein
MVKVMLGVEVEGLCVGATIKTVGTNNGAGRLTSAVLPEVLLATYMKLELFVSGLGFKTVRIAPPDANTLWRRLGNSVVVCITLLMKLTEFNVTLPPEIRIAPVEVESENNNKKY